MMMKLFIFFIAFAREITGSSTINQEDRFFPTSYYLHGAEHLKLSEYYFDMPIYYNTAVKKWMDYFLTRGRGFLERYSSRAGKYAPLMSDILAKEGVPRDIIFLAMAESGFSTVARSPASAMGPWQFMRFTGQLYGLQINSYIDERRDPFKSTVAASRYLKKLYQDFGSWELAFAAYNAGEGKVQRAINRTGTKNFWKIAGTRHLKRETKDYVPKVMAFAIIGKNLRIFDLHDIDFDHPLEFDEITVGPLTDLYLVAEKLKVDFSEIQELNPEILSWFTPPDTDYTLRIPTDSKTAWKDEFKDETKAVNFKTYKVQSRKGATLTEIAKKLRIYPNSLVDLNNTTRAKYKESVLLPFRKGHSGKERLYSSFYIRRPVKRRNSTYNNIIANAKKRGKRITNPTTFYTVQKNDSLWELASKFNISLDDLIASNLNILQHRSIRSGDKLIVR